MKAVKRMIKAQKPFAIVKYYQMCKGVPDLSQTMYELIYIDKVDEKYLETNDKEKYKLYGDIIKNFDIDLLRALLSNKTLKKVVQNDNGVVYEFMDFKKHKDALCVGHKKFIKD